MKTIEELEDTIKQLEYNLDMVRQSYEDCKVDRDKWKLYAEKAEEGFADTSSWYQAMITDYKVTYAKHLKLLRDNGIIGPLDFEP